MKKLVLVFSVFLMTTALYGQDECFKRLEEAFSKRGAYGVGDDMHRNVIVSFFEKDGSSSCVAGKARVENGKIVSVLIQYDDDTYEPYDKKFYNDKKQQPAIINGITEMIYSVDGEKFRIVFIEKLKPKQKTAKEVVLPEDL
ncbi:MAG: hypothetical protein V4638_07495 [Bacteroidota bacterium]